MQWYKIVLSQEEVAFGSQTNRIQMQFTEIMQAHGFPSDAAMFSRRNEDGGFAVLYFSPGAVRIANALIIEYYGSPCDKPAEVGTALLVGSDASRHLLSSED